MPITVNELTVIVSGNVVKNAAEGNATSLRMTQEQAQDIYDQLGPVLDFFKSQAASVASSVGVPVSNKKLAANLDPASEPVNGSQEALKNQVDGVPPKAPAGA